jgi:hypothetical protein
MLSEFTQKTDYLCISMYDVRFVAWFVIIFVGYKISGLDCLDVLQLDVM